MAAADKAFQAEMAAFKAVQQKLAGVGTAFQSPAGADAGFPDFGFTVTLPSKKIDLHIEYKASHTAQMGSMRDWRFDGTKFYSPEKGNEQKDELIMVMNETSVAVQNAKRLLADLKKYFSSSVTEISSGSLSVVKDKFARRKLTDNFVKNTKNYVIANISSSAMGEKIIQHYKKKFKKVLRRGTEGSLLIMMINKDMWIVDQHGSVTEEDIQTISSFLGVRRIPQMPALTARLECRIQPRGLSAPAANPKPTSIDVMASYRLQQKPSGGVQVI